MISYIHIINKHEITGNQKFRENFMKFLLNYKTHFYVLNVILLISNVNNFYLIIFLFYFNQFLKLKLKESLKKIKFDWFIGDFFNLNFNNKKFATNDNTKA